MPIITCGLNIFDYDQSVYLAKDDGTMEPLGKSTLENLDHFIVTCCGKYDINKVRLVGLQQYTLPLKNRIEKESIARYSKKIEVEI